MRLAVVRNVSRLVSLMLHDPTTNPLVIYSLTALIPLVPCWSL